MQPSPHSVAFTVDTDDARSRALVAEALTGAGAPAGVIRCEHHERGLVVVVDDTVTSLELVMAVIDVELAVGGRAAGFDAPLDRAAAAHAAAAGLGDPELGEERIIEYHLERVRGC